MKVLEAAALYEFSFPNLILDDIIKQYLSNYLCQKQHSAFHHHNHYRFFECFLELNICNHIIIRILI